MNKKQFVEKVEGVMTGISQVELANKIGVSTASINSWLNPARPTLPSPKNLAKLAKALNVDIGYLDKVETVAEARATGECCVIGTIRGVRFCVENSEATEGISIDAWVADSPWINVPVKGLDV